MNEIITQSSMLPVVAKCDISIRPATMDDVPFIDAMQKKTKRQVGFMPTAQIEGKIKLGHVRVAEGAGFPRPDVGEEGGGTPPLQERLGYVIGNDQYFKHDDVGIIYALNVVPGSQRKLIGATLIKAMFERAAYGCKLFCCWCAQDIQANYFWESIGFVPIAFRTGSREKGPDGGPRVHIFWQKRIREGDMTTPYWFPHETKGGAIREDRLVLPIPPGTHWKEAKPVVLPGAENVGHGSPCLPKPKRQAKDCPTSRKITGETPVVPKAMPANIGGGLRFAPVKPPKEAKPKAKREPKPKQKNDPRYVAAARELRDRWMEEVQSGRLAIESQGKYAVARMIEMPNTPARPALLPTVAA